jgi:hypothetical protein
MPVKDRSESSNCQFEEADKHEDNRNSMSLRQSLTSATLRLSLHVFTRPLSRFRPRGHGFASLLARISCLPQASSSGGHQNSSE